jgi:TfoX/Sxy family transcriptional regulator of competence genes
VAFDELLGERIRKRLTNQKDVTEKKMFGGLAFLLNGNMCVGVHEDGLIVRLDPEATDAALKRPHATLFDMTGRPMKGWIVVDAAGVKNEKDLKTWVDIAVEHASKLPKK